jgi:hypothetical protein
MLEETPMIVVPSESCDACQAAIQNLIAYLNAETSADLVLLSEYLEKTRLSCQLLLQKGVLEAQDFDSVQIRYTRLQRLRELDAPPQIIAHEFTWLKRMAGILLELTQGREPIFTEEEQEDLEQHRHIEELDNLDDRRLH